LTAFILQSVHSYEHLRKAFTEKQCHHVYQKNKTVIGHEHIGWTIVCNEFTSVRILQFNTLIYQPAFIVQNPLQFRRKFQIF
jgi:hypothetical protein